MTILYRILDQNFPQETRYYGITDSSTSKRLSEHLRLARLGKRSPLLDWIRKIQKQKRTPIIEEIERFNSRKDACLAEIKFIAEGRKKGYKLLNLANGGDGGRQPEDVILKISASKKLHAENNPVYYKDLARSGHEKMKSLRDQDNGWERSRIESIKNGIQPGQRAESQRARMNSRPELKSNLSSLYKGKPRKGLGRRKPVKCSGGLSFETVKDAADHYKIHSNTVTWSLTNSDSVIASGKSVQFFYVNPADNESKKKRRIISSEGVEFPTITDAARHYGADWVTIQRAIKQNKSYNGVTFTMTLV